MPELDDVVAQALEERTRSLAEVHPSRQATAAVSAHVRGRRVRRRVLQATLALPVVAILVAGGWALADRDTAPVPPVTRAPSPTATAEPSPTATSEPTATEAPPVALPDEPGLPSRYAAPEGVLAMAQPGWVLSTYTPGTVVGDQAAVPGETVVVLTEPDGTTFELLRLDPRAGVTEGVAWVDTAVVDWQAGSPVALVARPAMTEGAGASWTYRADVTYAELDLRTGALTPADPATTGLHLLGHSGDATVWLRDGWNGADASAWPAVVVIGPGGTRTYPVDTEAYGDEAELSPDGSSVLVGRTVTGAVVLDVASGAVLGQVPFQQADGSSCEVLSWWTAQDLLVECSRSGTAGPDAQYLGTVGMDALGAAPAVLGSLAGGEGWLTFGPGSWVGDQAAVLLGAYQATPGLVGLCSGTPYLVRGPEGSTTPLGAVDDRDGIGVLTVAGAGSDVVIATTPGGCGDSVGASVLTSVDVSGGTTTTLLPLPSGYSGDEWDRWAPRGWALGY